MATLTLKAPAGLVSRPKRSPARFPVTKPATKPSAVSGPSLHEMMRHTLGIVDSGVRDLGHNPKYLAGFGHK